MNFNEYQRFAISKLANDIPTHQLRMATFALGLSGESGETADHIKKWIGHGHEIDYDHIAKELGDILWYVAVMASEIGFDLDEIAARNEKKLNDRYPSGFSTEKSINRGN